jgi:hypothetical protein
VTDEIGNLVSWLCAQLDEDERIARTATPGPWWHNPGKAWLAPEAFEKYDRSKGEEFVGYGQSPLSGCIAATGPASHAQSMADAEHIARHNPVRALAEVAAKRQIVSRHTRKEGERQSICAECGGREWKPGVGHTGLDPYPWVMPWPCPTLRLLALPYADREGYRKEWKP